MRLPTAMQAAIRSATWLNPGRSICRTCGAWVSRISSRCRISRRRPLPQEPTGPYEVGRVIARPFEGEAGHFKRTTNRKDYATPPPKGMLLDQLTSSNVEVGSVGKIYDVFLGRGIRDHVKTKSNADGMDKTLQ